jgi:hypothetical protein
MVANGRPRVKRRRPREFPQSDIERDQCPGSTIVYLAARDGASGRPDSARCFFASPAR